MSVHQALRLCQEKQKKNPGLEAKFTRENLVSKTLCTAKIMLVIVCKIFNVLLNIVYIEKFIEILVRTLL